jgi:hypothetical protein
MRHISAWSERGAGIQLTRATSQALFNEDPQAPRVFYSTEFRLWETLALRGNAKYGVIDTGLGVGESYL